MTSPVLTICIQLAQRNVFSVYGIGPAKNKEKALSLQTLQHKKNTN